MLGPTPETASDYEPLEFLYLWIPGHAARTTGPTPAQLFYVPFPEDQLLQGLQAIESGGAGNAPTNPVTTYVSIAAVANGTIVYCDQWENGYDADIANPANLYSGGNPGGTQIWGDGDASNGAPPGIPSDLINAGTVIILSNDVNTGTPLAIDFDGRDKIAATKTVAVSRTGWAAGSGTLLAGSVEVFDTSNWGTDYRVPVGVNIPDGDDAQMFEYTSLHPGRRRRRDHPGRQGRGHHLRDHAELERGRKLLRERQRQRRRPGHLRQPRAGGHPDRRHRLQLREPRLLAAAGQPVVEQLLRAGLDHRHRRNDGVALQPGLNPLTVQYTTRNGLGVLTTVNLNVPGGAAGGYLPQVIPDGYGAHFATAGLPFYAFSTTDSTNASNGNQAWDWGFTLVPEDSLMPQVLIGLGIGRDPTSLTNPLENGNPVWVTPVNNGDTAVTVYVDYDADPATGPLTDPNGNKYDVALSLKELERAKIYDTNDRNQTGMLVYTLSPGIKLAAAWGQDPSAASGGAPGLDVGTGVPPLPLFSAGKNGTLFTDSDGDGFVSPGDVQLYTIGVSNISRAPVPDLLLKDTLPPGTTYVPNSTFFENAAAVVTPIPDNGVGTPFPLDGSGVVLDPFTALPVGGSYEVTFKVTINTFANLPPGTSQILNICSATAVGITVGCQDTTPLYGRIGDFVWNDIDGDTIQDGGPEVGIPGVTVNLYVDLNGNGIVDGADAVIATQVTNGSGGYLFLGVPAGTYVADVVGATVPPTLTLTTANDPTAVNLAGGEWRLNVDFGYRNLCITPGGQPVVCSNGDQCNDPGVCQPATGTCSAPVPHVGSCSDGNACTQTDTCQAGSCAGGNPVVCPVPGVCHLPGTCDPGTGQCSDPNAPDGTICNDGSMCTINDQCINGTCLGTSTTCGNGVVDCGEECDDGNTVDGDGCDSTCMNEEPCSDQIDNDDDGLIDCLDPDCPNCPPIIDTCNHPCVSQIVFQRRGLDLLRFQASFKPLTAVDPATEQVGVLITNADGVVFADLMPPGTLRRVGKSFSGTVKAAKTAGGIYKIKITPLADGSYRVNIKGYEEMSATAILPAMNVQLLIGDDVASSASIWTPIKVGWRVQLP